jgi:hypothetical protein
MTDNSLVLPEGTAQFDKPEVADAVMVEVSESDSTSNKAPRKRRRTTKDERPKRAEKKVVPTEGQSTDGASGPGAQDLAAHPSGDDDVKGKKAKGKARAKTVIFPDPPPPVFPDNGDKDEDDSATPRGRDTRRQATPHPSEQPRRRSASPPHAGPSATSSLSKPHEPKPRDHYPARPVAQDRARRSFAIFGTPGIDFDIDDLVGLPPSPTRTPSAATSSRSSRALPPLVPIPDDEDEDEDDLDDFDALFDTVQSQATHTPRNADRPNPFMPTALAHGQTYPTIHYSNPAPWIVGVARQVARQTAEDSQTEVMCAASVFSSKLSRPQGEALPVGTAPLHSRVQQLLRTALDDPHLTAHTFGNPAHGSSIAPQCLLVKNLSGSALVSFRRAKTVSSRTVTVAFVPINQLPPELVLLLNGLAALGEAEADEEAIRNAIADRWYNTHGHLLEPFLDNAEGNSLALLNWVRTLRVRRWDYVNRDNVAAPYYTVYVKPPTTNPARWGKFRTLVASFSYNITGYGYAASGKLLDCLVCHGADHNGKLCPHRTIEGWVGPSGAPRFKHVSSGPPPRN